jgi:hypothetical protein
MIKAFCCFYNEAALIPFFLSHYHFVHAIEAFVSPSLDATRELLAADPRVLLRDVEMPDGIDDDMKVAWLNAAIRQPDNEHAWHLVLDADEFIWPPGDPACVTVEAFLAAVPVNEAAVEARMVQTYRHESESDLDPTIAPVVLQRRHGFSMGIKPIVLRSNLPFEFAPGNHKVYGGGEVSTTRFFEGAHWQNADPSFAVTRRIRDRKERISAINRARGHGVHHYTLTEAEVLAELEAHRHDDQRF